MKKRMSMFVFLASICLLATLLGVSATAQTQERKVFSPYFTWYDAVGGDPINDHVNYRYADQNNRIGDYLAVHPLSCTSFDTRATDWSKRKPAVFANPFAFSRANPALHASEFQEMRRAGIDIAMLDFWASPYASEDPQSYWTMDRIAEAIVSNKQQGKAQPKFGLFVETDAFKTKWIPEWNAWWNLDLTTDAGGDRLFDNIAFVFRRIPREHWGSIDNRPIVAFYRSYGEGLTFGARGLKRARTRFQQEFGVDLCYLGNTAIKRQTGTEINYTWEWGASRRPSRCNLDNDIASVSPGYKNWKGNPTDTPPDVNKYRAAWESVRASGKNFVWVEAWNEYHESLVVAKTKENGSTFFEITRRQSNSFRERR